MNLNNQIDRDLWVLSITTETLAKVNKKRLISYFNI